LQTKTAYDGQFTPQNPLLRNALGHSRLSKPVALPGDVSFAPKAT